MRRSGGRHAAVVAVVLAMAVPATPVLAGTHHSRTPYPGGTWSPPPARYGVVAQKNVLVPMDDGARLVADVYYPASLQTHQRAAGRFPVLLTQSPYSVSLNATNLASQTGPGAYFVERGYIFVSADVRGSGRSLDGQEAFFSPRDAKDGVDLVNWVAHLPGSNGKVGLQGCSYLGQTQLYTAALLGKRYGRHQPVKAMVPGCIGGDVYRDVYSDNGIPAPAWVGAGLLGGSELGASNELYMVPKYLQSQDGGDAAFDHKYWLDRDHVRQAADIVRANIPTLLYDGWLDNGFGGLELYAALQNAYFHRDPFGPLRPGEPVSGRYQAITGLWHHGGGLDYGIELEWYDTWLKDERTGLPTDTKTPLHLYEQNRGWIRTSSYPMVNRYTRYYLAPSGLTRSPHRKGTSRISWGPPSESGTSVSYLSRPLAGGATLAGPSAVTVTARSTTANLELMADLYDVAPNGSEVQITHGGLMGTLRALDHARSWRDRRGLPMRPFVALRRETPVVPGVATSYSIPLQPAVWSLAPNHRLELRLSTQADPQTCLQKLAQIEAPVLGCAPRAQHLAELAGGSYSILLTGTA
ncbi:MAG TPA: CocE/NonD family hydrolase, partial [Mycobacteriales bacterium]|nr:CocE/NonD family hydrolase [Mycobacteriales bacterium]